MIYTDGGRRELANEAVRETCENFQRRDTYVPTPERSENVRGRTQVTIDFRFQI